MNQLCSPVLLICLDVYWQALLCVKHALSQRIVTSSLPIPTLFRSPSQPCVTPSLHKQAEAAQAQADAAVALNAAHEARQAHAAAVAEVAAAQARADAGPHGHSHSQNGLVQSQLQGLSAASTPGQQWQQRYPLLGGAPAAPGGECVPGVKNPPLASVR